MSTIGQRPHLVIEPPKGWQAINVRELWAYREMIWQLTLRDIKSRYKQSALGPLWVVLIPLASAGIFGLILGGLADLPSGGIPYPVFVFAGMLVWGLFTRAFQQSGASISSQQHLITKVYFPRLVAPISGVAGSILDFVLGSVLLAVLMLVAKVAPPVALLFAPVYVAMAMLVAMGMGLWVAALSVKFRDLRYATPFLVQILMWLTPVAYSSELVFGADRFDPAVQRVLEIGFQLNPLFWVVEGFRWSVLGHEQGAPNVWMAVSLVLAGLMLVLGLLYFRRVDATVADIV